MGALNSALGPNSVVLGATATDWRSAVSIAGEALVASGRVLEPYTAEMLRTIDELGPYVVLAPGLAMPHARPSELVLATGMSLVVLASPVVFGHPNNDPVRVLFGLAALDHQMHLDLLSDFAARVAQPGFVNSLLTCGTEAEIRQILS